MNTQTWLAFGDAEPTFRLATSGEEAMSVRPLVVPSGTWVRVRKLDTRGRLELELAHAREDLAISVSVPPGAKIEPPALDEAFDPERGGQTALFRAEPDIDRDSCARIDVELTLPALAATAVPTAVFAAEIPIDRLLFTDLARESDIIAMEGPFPHIPRLFYSSCKTEIKETFTKSQRC